MGDHTGGAERGCSSYQNDTDSFCVRQKRTGDYLQGQVPLVCGTGRYDTLNTIKMSQFAQEHGADCVMVILPFYLNPHKKAVMQHFRDLRATLDIDIMVYNNPWFAGYELKFHCGDILRT